MNNEDLKNNLKGIKDNLKDIKEYYRIILGALLKPNESESLEHVGHEKLIDYKDYEFSSRDFPTYVITPEDGHYMTTFFDIDALSPDSSKLCVTQLPFIDRIPIPGNKANICIINLEKKTLKVLYKTVGWGAQLGANVQWFDDQNVIFNDFIDDKVVSIKLNIVTQKKQILDGPVFTITPDRKYTCSPNLELINALIPGYGVPDPLIRKKRQFENASSSEGIWRTNLSTGKSELFLSIEDIVKKLPSQNELKNGKYYIFNVKVSSCGTKMFFILFSKKIPNRFGRAVQLVTCNIDGSNIKLAIPDEIWRRGGHHPNWTKHDNHIVMNLKVDNERLRLVKFNPAENNIAYKIIGNSNVVGSGHPSISPCGKYLITDAYVSDKLTDNDGYVPIRLIDIDSGEEQVVCEVYTNKLEGPRRIDPHPVWVDNGRKIIFNGVVNEKRQVLLMDMSRLYCEQ
jgi:hypothetical protein